MGQLVCEVTGCRPERKCQSGSDRGIPRSYALRPRGRNLPAALGDDGMGPTVNSFPEFTFDVICCHLPGT